MGAPSAVYGQRKMSRGGEVRHLLRRGCPCGCFEEAKARTAKHEKLASTSAGWVEYLKDAN